MNFNRFSCRQPRRNQSTSSHRLSIQLLQEPTPKEHKSNELEGAFTLNITNMARRQPRKSMLGTRRTTRESLLPLPEMITVEEILPISPQRNDRVSNTASPKPKCSPKMIFETSNAGYDPFKSPSKRKIVLSPSSRPIISSSNTEISPCMHRLETIFSQDSVDDNCEKNESIVRANINEDSILATTLVDNTVVEKSSTPNRVVDSVLSLPIIDDFSQPKRQLEAIFSQEIRNDSFEKHETILKANENEESLLATTLIDESFAASMDKMKMRVCDSTTIGENMTDRVELTKSNDEQRELLIEWFQMLDSMILAKNQEAAKLQTQLDEVFRQKAEYENMKRRIASVFKFVEPIERIIEPCKATDNRLNEENSKFHWKPSINSPKTSKVNETIKDLQSTLKFLKTPRISRFSRSSILLTPHTMSFSVKAQFEKLME